MTFPPRTFTAACVQLNSKRTLDENLPTIRDLIVEAQEMVAQLVELLAVLGVLWRALLGATHPPDGVLVDPLAAGARVLGRAGFRLLGEEGAFVKAHPLIVA